MGETYVFSIFQGKRLECCQKERCPFSVLHIVKCLHGPCHRMHTLTRVYAMSACRTVNATPAPSQSAFMGGATFIMSTVTSLACG